MRLGSQACQLQKKQFCPHSCTAFSCWIPYLALEEGQKPPLIEAWQTETIQNRHQADLHACKGPFSYALMTCAAHCEHTNRLCFRPISARTCSNGFTIRMSGNKASQEHADRPTASRSGCRETRLLKSTRTGLVIYDALPQHAFQRQQAAHVHICCVERPPRPPHQGHLALPELRVLQVCRGMPSSTEAALYDRVPQGLQRHVISSSWQDAASSGTRGDSPICRQGLRLS